MKHLQGLTVAVLAVGLIGVGTPGIASAAQLSTEQAPLETSLQGECFVERCAPGESAAAFEDLFSYIATIPDSVLMSGDAATNEYIRANPRNGNSTLVSTNFGQPDPLRCVAAVGAVLVSVLVPAARLLKLKELARGVGGVREAVRLLVGATSAAEKTAELGIALGAIVGELTGIAGIRDTCFS